MDCLMFVSVRWLDPFRLKSPRVNSRFYNFRRFCGKSSKAIPKGQKKTNSNSVFKLIFSLFLSRAVEASPKVRSESPWVTSTSGGCGALPTRRQFSVLGKPRAPKGIQCSNCVSMSGRISFCVSKYKHDLKEHGNSWNSPFSNRKCIFQCWIFQCYVSLPEGKFQTRTKQDLT